MRASAPKASAPREVLQRSLFSRSSSGRISEGNLQRLLRSDMDLQFPARLGVVSLNAPFEPSKGASLSRQALVAETVRKTLAGSERFEHVTDVTTALPNPKGIEGLRTIAARYRLRYLLLWSSQTEDQSHLNNWAWLYPTIVGIFAAPGVSAETQGMVQASLFDVQTGTVLFTAMQPYHTNTHTWAIGASRAQAQADSQAERAAAKKMAIQIIDHTEELISWYKLDNGRRQARAEAEKQKQQAVARAKAAAAEPTPRLARALNANANATPTAKKTKAAAKPAPAP